MQRFDEPMTTIVLSEKPMNMTKLNAALGKKAADNYFEFTPQVQLVIDAEDNLNSISIWADNISIGGNSGVVGDVVIEDGRARGTARMTEPGEFIDKKYTFEASFDVNLLGRRVPTTPRPAGALAADSFDGLPVPEGHEGMQSEGSRFRKQSSTKVAADLKAVVDFYRLELASGEWGQWQENSADAKVEQQTAQLAFSGPSGTLLVQLKAEGQETVITLVSRDAQAAKAAGMMPAPGKSRLVIANASTRAAVITINKREYRIAAGAGGEDPKTGLNWEIGPGNYTVEVRPPGQQVQSETIKIQAGETWGVIIGPTGGYLTAQLY
jgi:hypothetical protein